MRISHPGTEIDMNDQISNIGLYELEERVMKLSQKELHFGIPKANREVGLANREISRESGYNLEEQYIATNKLFLTQDQREV